jgi:hypothetical protein
VKQVVGGDVANFLGELLEKFCQAYFHWVDCWRQPYSNFPNPGTHGIATKKNKLVTNIRVDGV